MPFISNSCYFFLEWRFYSGLSTLMSFKWTIVHILHWSQGLDFITAWPWHCPSFIQVPEAFTVKLMIHPLSSNLGCRTSYFLCLIAPAVPCLLPSLHSVHCSWLDPNFVSTGKILWVSLMTWMIFLWSCCFLTGSQHQVWQRFNSLHELTGYAKKSGISFLTRFFTLSQADSPK